MVKKEDESKMDQKENEPRMDQKEFDSKMDQTARRLTDTVTDGVKRIEEAFEKGKENVREDIKGSEGMQNLKGSPRMGLLLLGLGFAWFLNTVGVANHWAFPIILMAAGLYFVLRNR